LRCRWDAVAFALRVARRSAGGCQGTAQAVFGAAFAYYTFTAAPKYRPDRHALPQSRIAQTQNHSGTSGMNSDTPHTALEPAIEAHEPVIEAHEPAPYRVTIKNWPEGERPRE